MNVDRVLFIVMFISQMKLSKYIQVKISDNVTIWDSNEVERVEIGLDWDWSVQGSVVGAHP